MFPGLTQFPEGQILSFGLVFLRCSGFAVAWPIFGVNNVPVQLKVLFALILSVLLFPTLSFSHADQIVFEERILFFAGKEVLIGLFLGYFLRLLMMSVMVAGDLLGISAGLASAQMFNPMSGSSSNVLEQFYMALATLILLAINGHHLFVVGFSRSFDLVPVTSLSLHGEAFGSVARICSEVFVIGLKMAAPMMVAVFLSNLVLGVLGRAVPQINVFVMSLQVTLLIGFVVILLGFPYLSDEMNSLIGYMGERLFSMMKVI